MSAPGTQVGSSNPLTGQSVVETKWTAASAREWFKENLPLLKDHSAFSLKCARKGMPISTVIPQKSWVSWLTKEPPEAAEEKREEEVVMTGNLYSEMLCLESRIDDLTLANAEELSKFDERMEELSATVETFLKNHKTAPVVRDDDEDSEEEQPEKTRKGKEVRPYYDDDSDIGDAPRTYGSASYRPSFYRNTKYKDPEADMLHWV